jgi:hypothetical protein
MRTVIPLIAHPFWFYALHMVSGLLRNAVMLWHKTAYHHLTTCHLHFFLLVV